MALRQLAAAFVLSAVAQGLPSGAAAQTTLYTFTGLSDGGNPAGGLVGDTSGNLYGATAYGGSGAAASCGYYHCGTVFKLAPPASGSTAWTERVLYNFPGGISGFEPESGLVKDSTGALYGISGGGDPACGDVGCGNIYKLTPPASGSTTWTFSILYSFQGGSGGFLDYLQGPGLTFNKAGDLFGVTGTTVFELAPPVAGKTAWTFSTIYTFGTSFSFPNSSLVIDSIGALYGLATQGGVNGYGGVYKLTAPTGTTKTWSATLIYSIAPSSTGASSTSFYASGLVFDSAGNLYGVDGNGNGYGEVFKLVPPASSSTTWTGASIYAFTGGNDGAYPNGVLAGSSGIIYGAAQQGGSGCTAISTSEPTPCGTIFELKAPGTSAAKWTETTLVSFNAYDGYTPNGALIADTSGNLYGTTVYGGSWYEGVVFKISDPAVIKKPKCLPTAVGTEETRCAAR